MEEDKECMDKECMDKECIICKLNEINIQTNCKHNFCKECISVWYDQHKTCPYCRENIIAFNRINISSDCRTKYT